MRASDASQKPTLLIYRKKSLVFPRQSDLGAKRDGTKTYHVNIHESYSIRLSNYFWFTTQIPSTKATHFHLVISGKATACSKSSRLVQKSRRPHVLVLFDVSTSRKSGAETCESQWLSFSWFGWPADTWVIQCKKRSKHEWDLSIPCRW